jgi:hypothetical protein
MRDMWSAFLRDPTAGLKADGSEKGRPEFPTPQLHRRSSSYGGSGTGKPTGQPPLQQANSDPTGNDIKNSAHSQVSTLEGVAIPASIVLSGESDALKSYEEAILSRKAPLLKISTKFKTRDGISTIGSGADQNGPAYGRGWNGPMMSGYTNGARKIIEAAVPAMAPPGAAYNVQSGSLSGDREMRSSPPQKEGNLETQISQKDPNTSSFIVRLSYPLNHFKLTIKSASKLARFQTVQYLHLSINPMVRIQTQIPVTGSRTLPIADLLQDGRYILVVS